jgi:hypothetical protein
MKGTRQVRSDTSPWPVVAGKAKEHFIMLEKSLERILTDD